MPDTGAKWTPQSGPQTEFVASKVFEVVYGGARGGGKTDAALGEFALHAREAHGAARGLLVRRTRTALEPTIERARQIYAPEGALWRESKSRFEWPSGAVLYFRHLDREADAERYQGHSYTRVYVEELTQFRSPIAVDKLKATLRSPSGAPCLFRATCNPGGPGHVWVKARYIDAGPRNAVVEGGVDRIFIPARVADNPALLASDPGYVDRLKLVGSAALVRAWLEGDWSVVDGAFFDRWSGRNIVPAFPVPPHWLRIRSFDWGFASPFSVGWWAIAEEPTRVGEALIPRGAMVRYREWYGRNAQTGAGPRLESEAIAAGILERERGERVSAAVADPSIFTHGNGPSIAERMARVGCVFAPADNTRVGRLGAMGGWDQLRARIEGGPEGPMLFVFETCLDFIRTVPSLQHDPQRPEDVATESEDHIADETRYACMFRAMRARPLPPSPASPPPWPARRRTPDNTSWKCV